MMQRRQRRIGRRIRPERVDMMIERLQDLDSFGEGDIEGVTRTAGW